MSITTKKVCGKKALKQFVRFPFTLYKNVPNWVPALDGDEFDTLNPKKNAAFEFCDAELWLAYKDGKIAGRVAAIINFKSNELWKEKIVRFGWLDFIEDIEVLRALLERVREFGLKHDCESIQGPLGFTDMDKEGLLVEGYENLSPFTCLYNFPYYDRLLCELGYSKEVDWTQRVVKISEELPPMFQFAPQVEQRFGLHIARERNMFALCKRYGMRIFHMYNESFAPLFEFTPLTDTQIERYLQTYIPILDQDYVAVCVNDKDEPVGFAFCVPSLSKAVKKSNGKLLPFGLLRILHALRKNDTLEALMIGVLPEYQGKGVTMLMFKYIHENCIRRGIKRMILNPQLEENFKVQTLFEQYETTPYMRRRAYKASLQAEK